MASKYFSLDEVIERLDETEFDDESEDDFEGYLDDDEYGIEDEERLEEVDEDEDEQRLEEVDEDLSIGAEVVVGGVTVPEYVLQSGCSVPMEGKSPLDFFSLLVTDGMLEHIVSQTNLSAQQFIETHELAPHSRVRRWSKSIHTIDELRQFLAITIVMGLVHYSQIESYWTTQWPYSNAHFSFVSC